ncbi:MAG: hypothetical protein ACC726_04110 [Chloroflexota bacterium]
MKTRTTLGLPALALTMIITLTAGVSAQVATLRTPDPDAQASQSPAEEVDSQDALLQFASCMRDNGIDFPDPQFGVGGGPFGGDGSGLAGIDLSSSDFLDAVEACQSFLESLQPEVDSEQRAEQIEQLLEFAECMRAEGIDFPDPDPVRGLTIASFRGEDGELIIDPFSADFLAASSTCASVVGVEIPGSPPQG